VYCTLLCLILYHKINTINTDSKRRSPRLPIKRDRLLKPPFIKGLIHYGKVIGIDLGIKDFAITYDGERVSKYPNARHLAKYEKKLAKKQRIAARKIKGSNRRKKATRIVARVYEQVSNVRQDYLHKLFRKIVVEEEFRSQKSGLRINQWGIQTHH
jgi:transposase